MSISFKIQNDCDQSQREVYDCCYNENCPLCKGQGNIEIKFSKFRLSMCEAEAFNVLAQLKIVPEWKGSIFGGEMVKRCKAASLVSAKGGTDEVDRLSSLIDQLLFIAEEAEKYGEPVIWSSP